MPPRLLHEPARLAGASLLRLQSDERLATLAAAGHEAAFTAIVDRHRAALLRYCTGLVGPSRAEDVVQQALMNAHAGLRRDSDVRNLRSWLYRIAHNASLNTLRSVRDDLPLDPAQPAADGDPAVAVERSERLRSTLAAVDALPERQRAALLLRELEGRSHEDIAGALGVSSGAARQHLMRARAAVRHAATAITPYPLLARLMSTGGSGAGAGAGAGAGVLLGKMGVGVLATTAVVGGAAGTRHIVVRHHDAKPAAVVRSVEHGEQPQRTAAATPVPATHVIGTAAPSTAHRRSGHPRRRHTHRAAPGRQDSAPARSGPGDGRDSAPARSQDDHGGSRPSAAERPRRDGDSSRSSSGSGHEDATSTNTASRGAETETTTSDGGDPQSDGGDRTTGGGGSDATADPSTSSHTNMTENHVAATVTDGDSGG